MLNFSAARTIATACAKWPRSRVLSLLREPLKAPVRKDCHLVRNFTQCTPRWHPHQELSKNLLSVTLRKNSMMNSSTRNASNGRSQCWQNFHEESEAAMNKQINMELYAGHVYMSMSAHFNRDDVAYPGLAHFFEKSSQEEREHAKKLIDYLNTRGGKVAFDKIDKPPKDDWGTPLEAMEFSLDIEKKVNQSLIDLHGIADKHGDAQMCDFIETEYLQEQVDAIKKLGNFVTQARRVGKGLGEWEFDRFMMEQEP